MMTTSARYFQQACCGLRSRTPLRWYREVWQRERPLVSTVITVYRLDLKMRHMSKEAGMWRQYVLLQRFDQRQRFFVICGHMASVFSRQKVTQPG